MGYGCRYHMPVLLLTCQYLVVHAVRLLTQRLLLEEFGDENMRILAQELAEQDLDRFLLVEEGVEWSKSEEDTYVKAVNPYKVVFTSYVDRVWR